MLGVAYSVCGPIRWRSPASRRWTLPASVATVGCERFGCVEPIFKRVLDVDQYVTVRNNVIAGTGVHLLTLYLVDHGSQRNELYSSSHHLFQSAVWNWCYHADVRHVHFSVPDFSLSTTGVKDAICAAFLGSHQFGVP